MDTNTNSISGLGGKILETLEIWRRADSDHWSLQIVLLSRPDAGNYQVKTGDYQSNNFLRICRHLWIILLSGFAFLPKRREETVEWSGGCAGLCWSHLLTCLISWAQSLSARLSRYQTFPESSPVMRGESSVLWSPPDTAAGAVSAGPTGRRTTGTPGIWSLVLSLEKKYNKTLQSYHKAVKINYNNSWGKYHHSHFNLLSAFLNESHLNKEIVALLGENIFKDLKFYAEYGACSLNFLFITNLLIHIHHAGGRLELQGFCILNCDWAVTFYVSL